MSQIILLSQFIFSQIISLRNNNFCVIGSLQRMYVMESLLDRSYLHGSCPLLTVGSSEWSQLLGWLWLGAISCEPVLLKVGHYFSSSLWQ